jgi:hypothetical protein
MTFLLPLVVLGAALLLLSSLDFLMPGADLDQQVTVHLHSFLAILGSGEPWQGALLIATVSSLVGMLFDSYAFYRYQGITRRWFS